MLIKDRMHPGGILDRDKVSRLAPTGSVGLQPADAGMVDLSYMQRVTNPLSQRKLSHKVAEASRLRGTAARRRCYFAQTIVSIRRPHWHPARVRII